MTAEYISQDTVVRSLYEAIVNTIKENSESGNVVSNNDMVIYKRAFNAYNNSDIEELSNLYDAVMNGTVPTQVLSFNNNVCRHERRTVARTASTKSEPKTLIEFFKMNGLEVIDKRDKGGCLWVVGSKNEIDGIVRQACKMFYAGGNYAPNGGRATGHRTAWFTQCKR